MDGAGLSQKQLKKEKQKHRRAKNKLNGKCAKKLMLQDVRLEKAKKWIQGEYNGDNILKAYRKHFATDRMTALNELTILGFTFTDEQIEEEKRAVKHTVDVEKAKKAKLRAKREAKNTELPDLDQDDNFYYIAGYTSGGAPYGVTWKEMGLKPYENFDAKKGE